jgi:hypothetical protein
MRILNSRWKSFSVVVASVILAGCGGGTSTSSYTDNTITVGYLVDSAVANADYDCIADGEYDKKTGSDGSFRCETMSQIRFRVGDLIIGEIESVPNDGYVFPQDLVGVSRTGNLTDQEVIALAQLLQSLDSDGDPTNGISIDESVKGSLSDVETRFNSSELYGYLNRASINPDNIKSQTEAQTHLRGSLQNMVGVNSGNPQKQSMGTLINLDNYPLSTLTQELQDAISYMGNEERLAHDVYLNLYNYHSENGNEIFQLYNISTTSESTHVETVQAIVKRYQLTSSNLTNLSEPVADSGVTVETMPSGKYGVEAIQNLYDLLYEKGTQSQQDALEVGCMVEVTDVNDLNHYIDVAKDADANDIVDAFTVLRDASYNHYWAFDKGLKDLGVSDGCCSLGTIDGVNYCHSEYPKNEDMAIQGNGYGYGR